MHNHEFCYWLQGYFELTREATIELDKKQIECIRNHINLVEKVDGILATFPGWLTGMLDAYEALNVHAPNDKAKKELNDMIRNRLNDMFKHEIDGKYEGDQEELNEIHNPTSPGRPPFNPNQVFRC